MVKSRANNTSPMHIAFVDPLQNLAQQMGYQFTYSQDIVTRPYLPGNLLELKLTGENGYVEITILLDQSRVNPAMPRVSPTISYSINPKDTGSFSVMFGSSLEEFVSDVRSTLKSIGQTITDQDLWGARQRTYDPMPLPF